MTCWVVMAGSSVDTISDGGRGEGGNGTADVKVGRGGGTQGGGDDG